MPICLGYSNGCQCGSCQIQDEASLFACPGCKIPLERHVRCAPPRYGYYKCPSCGLLAPRELLMVFEDDHAA